MTDHQDYPLSHRMIKTTTAITVGGSSMVLSSIALAATVMGLVVATPLMLIFSPVLVPAVVAAILITGGFLATGGFCATASYLLYWMYKYVTGKKHPVGAENLDHLGQKIGSGVAELKGQAGQQIVKSGQEEQQHHHGQVGEIVQDIEIKGEQERIAAEGAEQQQQNKAGQQEEEVEKKQSKSGKKKQQNKGGQDSS